MGAPSLHVRGEGRRDEPLEPTDDDSSALRGNGRGTQTSSNVNRGRPVAVPRGNRLFRDGRRQESEEPTVPMKPGNAGGGIGLWFEVWPEETRGRRLA